MNLANMTLEQFMCEPENYTLMPPAFEPFDQVAMIVEPMLGASIGALGQGYVLHRIDDGSGNVALKHNGELVGCYFSNLLAIRADHVGKSLGVPLVLAAVKGRPAPTERKVSELGDKTLRKAWRVANGIIDNPWPLREEPTS